MFLFFFFNDPATPEISPLSLPDALPIFVVDHRAEDDVRLRVGGLLDGLGRLVDLPQRQVAPAGDGEQDRLRALDAGLDRKSTRLNSSHANISYAVFCLKKKKNQLRYVS